MIRIKPEYLLYPLLTPICIWAGADTTFINPEYYGPLFLSMAMFLSFIGSFILNEIIHNRFIGAQAENVADKYAVTARTALFISILLLAISLIIAYLINLYVFVSLFILSGLILLSGFIGKKVPLLKYLLLLLIAGIVVISGGLAVEPKLNMSLPGPVLPALFTMIFLLMIEITADIKNIAQDLQNNIKTLPVIIGIPKSLIMVIIVFILLILMTLFSVFSSWFGASFKIITIYIIDLPTLVLLILIWGNPNRRTLSTGMVVFTIGWFLSIMALMLD